MNRLFSAVAMAGLMAEVSTAAAFTVTFQNGESSSAYYSQTVATGRCACPPADPIRFGCDFTGWTSDGGATMKSYDEVNALAVTNDTTWTATFAEHAGRRLRVGVWSGPGSSGGLALKYHRLMWNNDRVEYVAVPPADVIDGSGFAPLDMFLIPGGTTAAMYSSMEKTGRQNLIDWVHAGGRYFGTCAGTAYCANDSTDTHIGLAPYQLTAQNSHKLVKVALTEAGQAELGSVGWNGPITNDIYYSSSPIMSDNTAANKNGLITGQFGFKVLGTYASGVNNGYIGRYALAAGTNKLGRLFLSAPHPEYQASSYPFITKGIQWLFKEGVVKPGDTAASILAAASDISFSLPENRTLRVAMGPATVTSVGWDASLPLARAIDRNADYQLGSVTADNLAAGALANFDVFVVLSHHADAFRPGGGSYETYGLATFVANGGKVLYMDEGDVAVLKGLRAVLHPEPPLVEFQVGDEVLYPQTVAVGECACPPADPIRFGYDFTGWTSDGGATVKSYEDINALAVSNDTTWVATFAASTTRRLRVGVWSGPGSSGGLAHTYHRLVWNCDRIQYKSVPEASVINGEGLAEIDMLLVPGGSIQPIYESMGAVGRQNLINWIHAGGRYYGTCAGTAYCSNYDSNNYILHVAPYGNTAQSVHQQVKIALTEAGQAEFAALGWEPAITNSIYYSQSPILSDNPSPNGNGLVKGTFGFKVLATYASGLNANHIGKYALAVGTNQLGRLYLTAPHPENDERNYPFIERGFQWLFKEGAVKPGDTAEAMRAASTGIKLALPKDRKLKVAFGPSYVKSFGWTDALPLSRAIDRNAAYQQTAVSMDQLRAGALSNYEVFVVITNWCNDCRSDGQYWSEFGIDTFVANGGKVLYADEGEVAVLKGLRACLEPEPEPEPEPTADWGYEIRGLGVAKDEVAAVFTNASEALYWKIPSGVTSLRFLAVAGGGAGGYSNGGGGGAGGMATGTVVSVTAGGILKIQVGAGGLAPTSSADARAIGGDSVVALGDDELVRVYGGGRGGSYNSAGPTAGGSGGGGAKGGKAGGSEKGSVLAADRVIGVSLGHAGGSVTSERGGGGGGAGAAGGKSSSLTAAGDGGKGVVCDITGTEICYAGGGGGGINSSSTSPKPTFGAGGTGGGGDGGLANTKTEVSPARNGVDGLGGGGGGSCTSSSYSSGAGRGGSGVVVLRYVSVEPPKPTADGEQIDFDAVTFTDTSKVNSRKTIVFPEEPIIVENVITYGSTSVAMQRYYDVSARAVAGGWQLVLTLNETAVPVISNGGEEGQKAIAVTGDRVSIHITNTYPGLWYALTDSAALGAAASWRAPSGFVRSSDLEAVRTDADPVRFYKVAVRDYE